MRAVVMVMVLLAGCTKTYHSEQLTEPAKVEQSFFSPAKHGTGVGPTINPGGGSGVAVVAVSIPEVYATVFRCQHGKFVIQGTTQRYRDLWRRFDSGDSAMVFYREVYRVRGTQRELVDYDFIDAERVVTP